MLQRSSQVGEFYRMTPPSVFDKAKVLPGSYMDIMIYDEEADKLVHIEFEQALRACCIDMTDAASEQADLEKLLGGGDAAGTALKRLFDSGKDHVNQIEDPVKKAAAKLLLEDPTSTPPIPNKLTSVANIIAAVKGGICLKMCITLARPFIEHHMLSAVAAVSGRDTGATLYGPADMRKQKRPPSNAQSFALCMFES